LPCTTFACCTNPKSLYVEKRLTLPLGEKDLLIKIRIAGFAEVEMLALGAELEEECHYLLQRSDGTRGTR